MLTQETKSKFGSVGRGPRNVRVLVLILPACRRCKARKFDYEEKETQNGIAELQHSQLKVKYFH